MKQSIFFLKYINFGFSEGKYILQNLSLSLDRGEIYALMGTNGAGKTTLFNLITGFIRPQSGDIFFNEKNITQQQPFKINHLGIGRTFQDLRIITKLSVKENIILSMKENPTDNILKAMLPKCFNRNVRKILEHNANNIIEQFFLSEVQHSKASEISYGEQKLLTLASCVANGATMMLFDEPVSGIQPEYRNKIAAIIKQLKEQGKTILLIEHNIDFITKVADKILFLHDGEISTFDNMETLRKDKQVMEAYI
ncbi:MAG: ATP-binding cassette domain-containing protein [Haliscomenobacter sp.]|nr:ATP-binding cassette domain-containing protein [Haliscomenobacter sp.]